MGKDYLASIWSVGVRPEYTGPVQQPTQQTNFNAPASVIKKGVESHMAITTVNDLKKTYPALVNQLKQEVLHEERSRIQALDALLTNNPNNQNLIEVVNAAKQGGISVQNIQPIAEHIESVDYMVQTMNRLTKRGI